MGKFVDFLLFFLMVSCLPGFFISGFSRARYGSLSFDEAFLRNRLSLIWILSAFLAWGAISLPFVLLALRGAHEEGGVHLRSIIEGATGDGFSVADPDKVALCVLME